MRRVRGAARAGVARRERASTGRLPTPSLGFPDGSAHARSALTPPAAPGGCVLDSDSVEPLFTFVNMEKALKETNRSYYFYPGRIPPDAVRSSALLQAEAGRRDVARGGAGASAVTPPNAAASR